MRFVESLHLQPSDAHWDHEPEIPKSREIKKGFFRFRGRSKPKLINSEICVFEFLSFGFAGWFMERAGARENEAVDLDWYGLPVGNQTSPTA